MLTLAIDSSQEIGTLALGRSEQILSDYHFHHKMDLLRRIVPNIERMLTDAGCCVQELDGLIISLGPGSFTGLRIGVSVAKTLAYSLGKPIIGVSTLRAIARGIAPTGVDLICPMIHARAGEVYWSLFDYSGEARLEDYTVSSIERVLDSVQNRAGSVCFCGTGAMRNCEEIRHKFGNGALVAQSWSSFARGAVLLEIGNKRLSEGKADDPFTLAPMYIKKPTPVVRLESGEFEREKS